MLVLTFVPIQQETRAPLWYFKPEGVQKAGFKVSACKTVVPAASDRRGKFRPPGMVSVFCISMQHLLHHLRTSPGASVNIKQIRYNFLMKLSG